MRSERGWIATLGSVRASLFLGMGVAILLVVASFCVPNPRAEGALPFNESIRVFFTPVSLKFTWFYALLAVTAAWGVNGLFGTWQTLRVHTTRDRRFVGIVLMHVGFLVGLVAHLAAGLGTAVEGQALLTSTPTEVAGRTLRVLEAEEILHPNGALRTFTSTVDFGGDVRRLGYNDPIFFDGFRRWILVQAPKEVGGRPRMTFDGNVVAPAADGTWTVGGSRYEVARMSRHATLKAPMILLQRVGSDTADWLGPGMTNAAGLRFDGLDAELGVMVVVRRNDGLPFIGVASVIFLVGLGLYAWGMARR